MSQINFFILPEEIETFVKELGLKEELIIPQPTFDIESIYTNDIEFRKEYEFFTVLIQPKNIRVDIKLEYIDNQDYYLVDVRENEVLEFDRGGVFQKKPSQLRRARLYYAKDYYHGEQLANKNEEFVIWCNNLLKKAKKMLFKYPNESGLYCSEKILKMINEDQVTLDSQGLTLNFDFVD